MTLGTKLPTLVGDFGLVSVSERLMWRDALARHVLDSLALPDWKIEEQIEPANATIACLIGRGLTDPAAITNHIFHMGSVRNQDAPSQ